VGTNTIFIIALSTPQNWIQTAIYLGPKRKEKFNTMNTCYNYDYL